MRVFTLNPIQDHRWREFVRRHPAGSVFHTAGWVDALQRTYMYEPLVFTTSRPAAELVNGILVCRVRSWLTGRRLVSVPFADHCEPLVTAPDERAAILVALRAAARGWRHVELRPGTSGPWEDLGLAPTESFVSHVLNLRPSVEEVFRGFHYSGIQRKIGRAERGGVSCQAGRSAALLQTFYRLMILTRRRHGIFPQPIEWFENLIACLGDRVIIRIALKDGRAIGSILTLQHGNTLVYKYGCSDHRFHNLGAMPFLFWKAIQEAKAAGIETFDLGRSDVDNPGLITFKKRLGAAASTLTYVRSSGRRQHAGHWRPRARLPAGIAGRLPERVFIAAGRLLYRHMG